MARRDAISEALQRLRVGGERALDRLVPLVFDDLRPLARRQLAHRRGQRLGTTGLVHETYLRVVAPRRATSKEMAR